MLRRMGESIFLPGRGRFNEAADFFSERDVPLP